MLYSYTLKHTHVYAYYKNCVWIHECIHRFRYAYIHMHTYTHPYIAIYTYIEIYRCRAHAHLHRSAHFCTHIYMHARSAHTRPSDVRPTSSILRRAPLTGFSEECCSQHNRSGG